MKTVVLYTPYSSMGIKGGNANRKDFTKIRHNITMVLACILIGECAVEKRSTENN